MPSGRTAPPSASEVSSSRRVWTVLAGGAALRLALSATALPELLKDRNELVTPITSWTRLQEGYHLVTVLHQDPYAGGSFHHPPLLLLLSSLASPATAPLLVHLVWTVTELLTARYLARIAQRRSRDLLQDENEQVWPAWLVAALYLLHPFSIATTLSLSTQVFTHLFLAWAFDSALQGNIIPAVFSLSIASHLSLYPALLLPPLVVLAYRQDPNARSLPRFALLSTGAFAFHQAIILGLSFWMTGSWQFLSSVYGVILTIPDLTPNIGISWYFFIEMFDHFRAFFIGVFQLHVLIYVAPLTFAFRSDPLFAAVLIAGIIALFKSYTALGDFAFWHALLAIYSELGAHITRPLVLAGLTLYALALLPAFHHLWLYSGSGNANFFYASTLVWAIGQGGLLIEVLNAKLRREVLRTLGEQGRAKVRDGKWRVIQR